MFKEDFVTIIRKYLQIIRFFANQEMVIRDGSLLLWLVSFVQILKTKSHAFNQFSRYNFNIYLPVWPHFICTGKSITYLTNHFTSLFCWLFRTFCLPLTLKYTGHSFNIFRGAVGQVVCHLITSTGNWYEFTRIGDESRKSSYKFESISHLIYSKQVHCSPAGKWSRSIATSIQSRNGDDNELVYLYY